MTDLKAAAIGTWLVSGQPGQYAGWEDRTKSQKYWAALETNTTTNVRALLLYIHHSTARCKNGNNEPDYNNGCGGAKSLPFSGYDARIWNSPPAGSPPGATRGYRESFTLKAGTYHATWINPETSSTLATQHVTCTSNTCAIASPDYPFDVLLRVVKR